MPNIINEVLKSDTTITLNNGGLATLKGAKSYPFYIYIYSQDKTRLEKMQITSEASTDVANVVRGIDNTPALYWYDFESVGVYNSIISNDGINTTVSSGISGISGNASSGISGVSGSATSGTSGINGEQGTSGISGNASSGTSGISGNATSGISGIAGSGGVIGLNKEIIFNDSDSLSSNINFTFNKLKNELSISGETSTIALRGVTGDKLNHLTSSSAHTTYLYAKDIAGRTMIKNVGSSGNSFALQPALYCMNVFRWRPTNVTAGQWDATVGAGAGTYTTWLPSSTAATIVRAMKWGAWANAATNPNQNVGQRNSQLMFSRGASANYGGFFFKCTFGTGTWTTGGRLFVGFTQSNTPLSGEPSSLTNFCGFAVNSSGSLSLEIYFMCNDASGTADANSIVGQPTLSANQGYQAFIYCPPNGNTIYYRLDNLNTQTTIVDSSTTSNLPASSAMMQCVVYAGNAALTPANSVRMEINNIYIETDN